MVVKIECGNVQSAPKYCTVLGVHEGGTCAAFLWTCTVFAKTWSASRTWYQAPLKNSPLQILLRFMVFVWTPFLAHFYGYSSGCAEQKSRDVKSLRDPGEATLRGMPVLAGWPYTGIFQVEMPPPVKAGSFWPGASALWWVKACCWLA